MKREGEGERVGKRERDGIVEERDGDNYSQMVENMFVDCTTKNNLKDRKTPTQLFG